MNDQFKPYGSDEQIPNYNTHTVEEQGDTPSPSAVPPVSTEPKKKMGKFKASKMIASASWNLLKKDKEMMLFPVVSAVINILFFVLMSVIYLFAVMDGSFTTEHVTGGVDYVFMFIFYVVSYFITVFFQAGIVAIAHGRINGRDLTFADGMNMAKKHSGKLFVWSMLSATVGMVLRAIAERSKLVGKIVVSLLGAAWSILSYFIVPALMLEDLSVTDSLKKSAGTIKRSWGETAIVSIGVGFIFAMLILLGFAVAFLSVFSGEVVVIGTAAIAFVIYVLILMVISSTLSIIFRVVLYEYATKGTIPEGFSEDLFKGAFKAKKK